MTDPEKAAACGEAKKPTAGEWQATLSAVYVDKGTLRKFRICPVNGRTVYEQVANARLIAAAKDLLEACKALADKADATSECDHTRRKCEDVGCIGAQIRAARAAIAKAEVRQ